MLGASHGTSRWTGELEQLTQVLTADTGDPGTQPCAPEVAGQTSNLQLPGPRACSPPFTAFLRKSPKTLVFTLHRRPLLTQVGGFWAAGSRECSTPVHRLRSGAARGKPPWPGVTEEGAHETASRGTCLGYQPSRTEGTPNVCWLPCGPHVLRIWTELPRRSQESELLFARDPFLLLLQGCKPP